MPLVAAIILAAGVLWGAIYARRGSLALGAAAVVAVGYVLGFNFWNAHVGPLPLTLDRIVLVGLVAAFIAQWRWGRLEPKPFSGSDWLLAVLLVILGTSALLAGQPEVRAIDGFSPTWRLVMSFVVPAVLYWIVRQRPLRVVNGLPRWRSYPRWASIWHLTGLAEITGTMVSRLPSLHFGPRARHPLRPSSGARTQRGQPGRLSHRRAFGARGSCDRTCDGVGNWCCLPPCHSWRWRLERRSRGRLGSGWWPAPRSSATFNSRGNWRLPLFTIAALGGVLVAAVAWNDVIGLQREGTANESEHSVNQRESFAYVSWQMFKDNPIFGVGFSRFYDRKLPYLSDRSQDFELESLRNLHHHNTLLSLLTETGMVGLAAFLALLAAWARSGWSLVRDVELPAWVRSQGLLMLAVLVTYLSSALFHDLTLLPSQEWMLFLAAGFTMNLRLDKAPATAVLRDQAQHANDGRCRPRHS